MRVFIIGATGYIGSAVAELLIRRGHELTGLARSAASSERLRTMGIAPVRGDLHDPDSFRGAAAESDVAIQLGFDFRERGVAADRTALETLLALMGESGGPRGVIYTSGSWVLGDTGNTPADESAPTDHPAELIAWRPAHELRALEAATDQLATAVIRPGLVYGGRGGTIGNMIEKTIEEGATRYIGPGTNRWSMIHRQDLAVLYATVAEARGRGIFHGVDGTPVRVARVAEAVSVAAGRGGATRSVPLERAREKLGAFADALCVDQVLIARRSAELGWRPSRPGFLENAEAVFREWSAAGG